MKILKVLNSKDVQAIDTSKQITKVEYTPRVVNISNSKQVVRGGFVKKIYSADIVHRIEELSVIGMQVGDAETRIEEVNEFAVGLEEAMAYQKIQLLSEVDKNTASIEETKTSIANETDARALQIAEVEASVNENLANYSDVLDLTVDEDGNVKAKAIETLTSSVVNQSIEIQETKTIAQDANGKWEANAGILITDNDGKITGIHATATEDISEVVVSADKFKIESAIGTPFSVINGEIYNNGKVNFTKNPTIATKDDIKATTTVLLSNSTSNDLLIDQDGTNLTLEVANLNTYNKNDKFSIYSSLTYKSGCILSFKINAADTGVDLRDYSQVFTISLINIETGAADLSLYFRLVYFGNGYIPSFLAIYASGAIEDKFYEDNPEAGFDEYLDHVSFAKNTDGTTKDDYLLLDDIVTFIYDDDSLIVQENGIQRHKAFIGADKSYRMEITTSLVNRAGFNEPDDLIGRANLELYKWERYYNNSNMISEIADVTQSLTALTVSTAQEQFSLNTKILEEAQERLSQDALLDERVRDEETARINALSNLQTEYKNYTDIVTKALADEVITPAEQALISEAWNSVEAAKNRFASMETEINSLQQSFDLINTDLAEKEIELANLDGKITSEEAARIASINSEQSSRIAAINARITKEALLDGRIDDAEQAQINASNALTVAYKNYTNTVRDALIDGEITDAEQNAINEAQTRINTAKANLETQISNLSKVEDIPWQTEVQNAINNGSTTINGDKIVTNEVLINNLNAVGGIVADTITATDFYGKNFYGSYFEGAKIVGAVIQASYWDTDGEFKLLTHKHISITEYNNSPSSWTDAILAEEDNEYRLPTLANIVSAEQSSSNSLNKTTSIYPYDAGNVNSIRKVVAAKPEDIRLSGAASGNFTLVSMSDGARGYNPSQGESLFVFGGLTIFKVTAVSDWYYSRGKFTISGLVGNKSFSVGYEYANYRLSHTETLSYGGVSFTFLFTMSYSVDQARYHVTVTMGNTEDLSFSHTVTGTTPLSIKTNKSIFTINLPRVELSNPL